MLSWRLAISAVLIPLLVLLFFLDARAGATAPLLFALVLLLGLRSGWELAQLLRPRFPNICDPACAACLVAVLTAAWLPHWGVTLAADVERPPSAPHPATSDLGPVALGACVCVLSLLALEAARFRVPGGSMETLGAHLLIVAYAGLLLAVTAQLRWVAGERAGYLAIGSLVVTAKLGDVAAYTLGRLCGRRKMSPLLSPGKTWAGAVGALLGSALAGWAWFQFASPLFDAAWRPGPFYWTALYGLIVGLAGLIGDLCESLIKRDLGRKDAAALVPGFGGLLDLLDSVLYAGPIAYVLWLVLPLVRQ